jgi:hypothetical protein
MGLFHGPLSDVYGRQKFFQVLISNDLTLSYIKNILDLYWGTEFPKTSAHTGVKFAITGHFLFMAAITALATFFCAKGVLDFSFDFSMSIVAVGKNSEKYSI